MLSASLILLEYASKQWKSTFSYCASCLRVRRPGTGALPPPTSRPFGRAAGARFPLAVGAVCRCWGPAVFGTFSGAAVRRVLCALPGFAAPGGRCGLAPVLVPWLWPAGCLSGVPCGPALVRRASSGPVALGAPVGFTVAVVPSLTPGAVAPGFTGWLRGARRGGPRTGLFVPAAGPCRGKGAGRAPRRTRSGPRDGVVPGGSLGLRSWAACAAVVWCVWTRSLARPVSRTVRLSTGDSAGAPGLFRVDVDTSPFGSEDATLGSRACGRVRAFLAGLGGPASRARFGAPHLFLWPFSVLSLSARPPPGWGRPACGFSCFLPFCASLASGVSCFPALGALGLGVLCPPPLLFFFPFFLFCAPLFSGVPCFPARGALGLGVLCPPPPSPLLLFFFWFPFSLLFCATLVSGVPCFPALGALGLGVLRPPPPPLLVFFLFFPCRGLPVVQCCGAVSPGLWGVFLWALCFGGGLCALALRRSVPPACASSFCVVACCVARVPLGRAGGVALPRAASGVCRFCPPPPRRLWCPLLWFVVPRALWRRGLWCVLCCARWCVECLCRAGFLCRVVWRGVVPGRVVLFLSCFAALRCCVLCWFWSPGWFRVVSVSVLCLCGAVLVCLRRCSLCGALLPLRRWLVFCVVACCVCVFAVWPGYALLSPGGSWWLLVSCFCGVLCCVPGCCAAPCCCALCRLALHCCALRCFFLLRFMLPRAVLCPGAPSVVLRSCAFWRRVFSCPPVLCVFCCGVSLRGVVRRCALCCVRPGVSCCALPVVSALCSVAVRPALPRCPAPLCCAPWCCAAAWCCGVLSFCLVVVLWRPALLPCRVCFLRLRGFTYLKNRCKIC